jgi:hypothetical protein
VYRCKSYYNSCTWQLIAQPTSSQYTEYSVQITTQGDADDRHSYYVQAIDTGGYVSGLSNQASVWGTTPLLRGPTADDGPGVPETYALGTSYPNPVRAQTTIRSLRPAGSIGRDAHRL